VTPVVPSDRATIAICGGGLIGTSLALALAAAGHHVTVADRDADVRRRLLDVLHEAGHGTLVEVQESWSSTARGCRIAIAAVPPPGIPAVLALAAEVADPGALLTDVASVKSGVVRSVTAALSHVPGAAARYVGGHPMAGSERSGPDAGDASLFTGATWVLTPTAETDDEALARAGDLARELGARVLVLGPDEHDGVVGLVSHLPQLVASILADVAAEAVGSHREAVMAVAGPGFRDTTRIAASDPTLWLDIVDGNRDAILAALVAFSQRLGTVVEAITSGDQDGLEAVLRRASAARQQLVPKGMVEPMADLLVPLRDRPGEIARITGALGTAGINIEDLAMRHATAADRGSLLLRVLATSVERAVGVLGDADVSGTIVDGPPASEDAR